MKLLYAIQRFAHDFPRQFIATCLTLLILSAGGAYAAGSFDVGSEVQMYLNASINTTATTIVLASPKVNGANFLYSTTTGAILRIRSGSFREDIYATSASVNATTNIVTLTGVTRNVCPYVGRTIVSCGAGRNWGKGAIVEVTVSSQLLNLKANVDRANTFTAKNGMRFSGSGSLGQPTFSTTALRDQQLGSAPASGSGLVACVTATGLCYDGLGGAWVARGNTGVSNATEAATGIVELATIADQLSKAATGDSGGPMCLQAKNLTSSGSVHGINNTYQAGRIPILGASGALLPSLGGTGLVNPGSGSLLIASGSGSFSLFRVPASGSTLISDGTRLKAHTLPRIDLLKSYKVAQNAGSFLSTNSTAWVDVDTTNMTSVTGTTTANTILQASLTSCTNDGGSTPALSFDIWQSGTRQSLSGSGIVVDLTSAAAQVTMNYTWKPGASGSYTIRPQWKVENAGTGRIGQTCDIFYSLTKIEP